MLFIDGEQVDLDEDTKITLNIKSNLFTDLSKIVSNNSYTIKLPKTVRNQRIIQHADLPACSTDYSRKYHWGRYFRNGIEIISNAKIVLISVSDKIDIAMTWGNSVSLSSLVEDGKSLNELNGGTILDGKYYPRYASIWKDWGENSKKYPLVNYGFKSNESQVWYHPAVTVNEILEYISIDNKVNFDFPSNKKNILDNLFIPLLTRNPNEEYAELEAISVKVSGVTEDRKGKVSIFFDDINGVGSEFGSLKVVGGSVSPGFYNSYSSKVSNAVPKISGEVEVVVNSLMEPISAYIEVYNYNFDGNGANLDASTVLEIPALNIAYLNSGRYNVSFYFKDLQTSLLSTTYSSAPYIKFALGNMGKVGDIVSISGTLKITNMEQKIVLGGKFWTIPNLPNIKQIDFIKALASLVGVFPVSVNDNAVKFISLDELIDNKSKAVDWTRKIVASYKENKPKVISYALDNFAQKNYYKWKEDNTVIGNFDDCLVVEDETIEPNRDAMVLPFAGSNMFSDVAKIPIYSYDKDNKLQYDKVEPRILEYSGIKGVFNNLRWSTLLSNYYAKYQALIRRPIIISEKIKIDNIDLKNLNTTIPVYLAQYGRYYAIINIKAEDTGICECKLLQLEI